MPDAIAHHGIFKDTRLHVDDTGGAGRPVIASSLTTGAVSGAATSPSPATPTKASPKICTP